VLCRGLEKNGMIGARYGHGIGGVNQTRPHCVNQIGKTHSKPLAARNGRGTAWTRHAMCESAVTRLRTWRERARIQAAAGDVCLIQNIQIA